MKKQITIAAFALGAFVFGTTNVQAQESSSKKISNGASTAVNIKLADVISIDSESVATGGNVDFNYASSEDYNTAKNVTVANSLIVTSSKNFDVKVKAEGANFVNGTNSIPVYVLQVKAITGGTTGTMSGGLKTITLSAADQTLVSNAILGPKRSLSIDYSISALNASTFLLGKPAGTYTQNVTYTATAL